MAGARFGHIVSQRTRDKISRSLRGNHNKKGKELSIESRKLISQKTKEAYKTGKLKPYTYWTGKKMPKSVRQKMSQSAKNSDNPGRFTKERGFKYWLGKKGDPRRCGKNHWNWKGGATTETRKRVADSEWRALIKEIYARDNWLCRICGKHCRKSIQCHHIIPVREGGSDDAENLATLCRAHHLKIERSEFQDFWRYYLNKGIKVFPN